MKNPDYWKNIKKEYEGTKRIAKPKSIEIHKRKKYALSIHSWESSWNNALSRCKRTSPSSLYKDKKIEFHLRKQECLFLWKRDNAENMEAPSLDRIDNDGNYTFSNCRFIERRKNVRGKARLNRKLSARDAAISGKGEKVRK